MKKQVLTSLFLALISIGAMAKNKALNAVTSGYAKTTTAPLLGNTAFTFEVWFNGTSATTYARLISFSNFAFEISAGGGTISIYDGTWRATGVTGMGTGWHHVAVTNDLTNYVVYVDGVQAYTKASVVRDFNNQTMFIGAQAKTQPLNERFSGKFDEVRVWNRALSALEVAIVKNGQTTGTESGLVAYYNFNDGTGTNKVNGTHNLTLTGSPTIIETNFTDYIQDFALSFDAADDKTLLATPISGSADFTFETQFQTTAGSSVAYRRLLSFTNYLCDIAIVAGVIKTYIGAGSWVACTGSFNDGNWHHLAATKSGTTLTIYVDGNVVGTRTVTVNLSGTMYIGGSSTSQTGDLFGGLLDEVRIWNTVRTQPEIEANMNLELIGNENGLISYWDFNTPTPATNIPNFITDGPDLTRSGPGGTNNYPQFAAAVKTSITTSVADVLSSDESVLTVYPNPFTSVITLNIPSVNKVIVMDATGKAVYSLYNSPSQIDLSSLNAGMYFMNVYSDDAVQTAIVIKQ